MFIGVIWPKGNLLWAQFLSVGFENASVAVHRVDFLKMRLGDGVDVWDKLEFGIDRERRAI